MPAENRIERAPVFNRSRIKVMTREIKKLFMDMAAADLDPEDRILDAIAKITKAQECIESFRRQHPAGRLRKVYMLFAELETACEKAEERMGRFEERRSAGIRRS